MVPSCFPLEQPSPVRGSGPDAIPLPRGHHPRRARVRRPSCCGPPCRRSGWNARSRWSSVAARGAPPPPRRARVRRCSQAQTAACGPMTTGHGRAHRLLQPPAGLQAMPDAMSATVAAAAVRFPHPLTLLVGCVCSSRPSSPTSSPPAGSSAGRIRSPAGASSSPAPTPRSGPAPVGRLPGPGRDPEGMADAAGVIFYVFLVGGAFAVVERTGALGRLVDWLVGDGSPGAASWSFRSPALAFGLGGVLDPDAGGADRLRARCSCCSPGGSASRPRSRWR